MLNLVSIASNQVNALETIGVTINWIYLQGRSSAFCY